VSVCSFHSSMFTFTVLSVVVILVFSYQPTDELGRPAFCTSQVIGWTDHLGNDQCCVE